MTEQKFKVEQLDKLDETDRDKLAKLAASVFDKNESDLTKQDILILLEMELMAIPTKLVISVNEARPTRIEYSSWRGGMEMELDLGGLKEFARNMVADGDSAIEDFLRASNYIRKFILSKLRRSEKMLREELNRAIVADGLDRIPNSRFESTVF